MHKCNRLHSHAAPRTCFFADTNASQKVPPQADRNHYLQARHHAGQTTLRHSGAGVEVSLLERNRTRGQVCQPGGAVKTCIIECMCGMMMT
jgi:hypothetical protein